MTIFNISQIYIFNAVVMSILTFLLLFMLFKKRQIALIIAFIIATICTFSFITPMCLEYAPIFFLMLIFSIISLFLEKKGNQSLYKMFFIAGILNCFVMCFDKIPTLGEILNCAVPILYSGLMSCGVAYTLQIIGQKYTNPTIASILMSFESVFAVIAGWIILGDVMTRYESFGCFLMFAAIVIVQLPIEKFSKKIQTNV